MFYDRIVKILKISTLSVLVGRAWQHIFRDIPLRSLLWDEELLKGPIEKITSLSWKDWVTNLTIDGWIQSIIVGFGFFYFFAALCTIFVSEKRKIPSFVVGLSSVSLIFLAFLYCKSRGYQLAMFFEFSAQFLSPVLLVTFIYFKAQRKIWFLLTLVAIAVTFVSHGLYAIGYYPVPGHFIDMCIQILGITEQASRQVLFFAGVLDLLIAVFIFIPQFQGPALIYAAIWGGLTALARTVSGLSMQFSLSTLDQVLYETLFRLPHMLICIVALVFIKASLIEKRANVNSIK